ncbi:MAG: hypothetical protein C0473_01415 [Cyanobacteria bacterium DS3.002]|nr:hypothetical protein [Cyanobacteria bacterium DS3.002]
MGVYQTPKSGALPFTSLWILLAWRASAGRGSTIDVASNFIEVGFDLNFSSLVYYTSSFFVVKRG